MTQGSLIIYGMGGDGQLWGEEEFQTRSEGGARKVFMCCGYIMLFHVVGIWGTFDFLVKEGQKFSDIRRVIRGGEIF